MPNYKVIVPRHNDNKYKMFAEPSIKKIGTQALQVFDKDKSKSENIFKKYNAGIEAAIKTGLNDDDIIIFMHEDTGIVDNLFKEKIELLFSEKTDVGLVGIAGAIELTNKGGWWMTTPDKMRGHLLQGKEGGNQQEGFHLIKGHIGYFDDVVAIDGCIMITKGKFLKEGIKFDDKTFKHNDFYDVDFCFQFLEKGYKIAVADILIFHKSSGMGVFNDEWKDSKQLLFDKWTAKGYDMPFKHHDVSKKDHKGFKFKQEINEIVEIDL